MSKETKEINCDQRKPQQSNANTMTEFLDNERLNYNNFLNMASPPIFTNKATYQSEVGRLEKALNNFKGRLNSLQTEIFKEMEATNGSEAIEQLLGKFGTGAIHIINSSIESVGQAAGKVKETINKSVNIIEDIKSILFWAGMITVLILILIFIWFTAPYCLMGMKFARIIQTTIGRPKNKKKITVAALQKEEKEDIPMEEVEAYILTYMPKICTIINKTRNKRPHFIVSINGRQLHALLDSGSDVTFCTKEIAQTLNLNIDETKCGKAEGIGAVQVPFIGSAVAEICVEEISIKAEIQISKDGWCPAEIVLGSDFLKKINQTHDININLQRKMIKIGETQIPLLVSTSEEQRFIKMEDQQIPSNSNENPPLYNQEIEFPTDFYKKINSDAKTQNALGAMTLCAEVVMNQNNFRKYAQSTRRKRRDHTST